MYSEDAIFEAMQDARYEREDEWQRTLTDLVGSRAYELTDDQWRDVLGDALDYEQALSNLEDLMKVGA